MLLTAGTFLQEGRYWVEGILAQDETGISYRAQHRNLERPVVIQTLGPMLCDRPDAPQLLQAFMTEVRRQSHAPTKEPPHVLDCFIEFSQPFVVLEMPLDAKPPSIETWIPNLKAILERDTAKKDTPEVVQDAVAEDAPPTLEPVVGAVTNGKTAQPASVAPKTAANAPKTTTQPAMAVTNGSRPATKVMVSQAATRRTPGWLPTSLALTAVLGGCAGAVFGWQLRQGKSLTEVVPVVGPKVDTDQSFPPIDGWPASEASEISGSGTGLDQVLQRRDTSDRQERVRPAREESVPIEPYPLDYGTGRSAASDYYDEPDYSYESENTTVPSATEQDVLTDESAPVSPSEPEAPIVESVEPPPAVAVEEPSPIQKPMPALPEQTVPETASPRSSSPPSAVIDTPSMESATPQ